MNALNDLLSLLYPDVCRICSKSLFRNENILCMKCMHHLPRSRFEKNRDNPAARVFWGRVPAQSVITAYLYNKGNAIQHLVHDFKYRGKRDIGYFLGERLGMAFLDSGKAENIDLIVPVPLHPRKKRKRGFNQSEVLAQGAARILKLEVNTMILARKSQSSTQTRKSKYQRWENVENIFILNDSEIIRNKHILLIDDVITTGATIESCAQELLQVEGVGISIGAVAFTRG